MICRYADLGQRPSASRQLGQATWTESRGIADFTISHR